MDEKRIQGGYGNTSDGLGSNFISFGPDSEPDSSHQRWNRRGGRGPQLFSGSRGHAPWARHVPHQQNHSRPFGHGRGRGFHQSSHMAGGGGFGQRGNRNQNFQRNQGPRSSNESSSLPISAYYHPSMTEDPWLELETLLKLPQTDTSSSSQCEPLKNLESENTVEDDVSNHSEDSEGSG